MDDSCPGVLVVEDSTAVRGMLADLLSYEGGFRVREAANGQEALTVLEGFRPDLILLDLEMPVMDGPTFLAQLELWDGRAGIPTIVLSANCDRWPSRIRADHVVDIVRKPFDWDSLLASIGRALHRRALAQLA